MDLFDGDGACGLFEVPQDPRLATPPPKQQVSRTAANHRKVARRIGLGIHPLGEPIRLHPDAPRDLDYAEAKASDSTGPRCGGCAFRQRSGGYPKCFLPTKIGDRVIYPRISGSETSDIAAWWPACDSWKAAGQ
jgi:hypothetical protein